MHTPKLFTFNIKPNFEIKIKLKDTLSHPFHKFPFTYIHSKNNKNPDYLKIVLI